MFALLRPRLFCAVAAEAQFTPSAPGFTGRVTIQSNPRSLAPLVTSNVLQAENEIKFSCIGRAAASKLVHAIAIANVKNVKDHGAFFKPTIMKNFKPDREKEIPKTLTPFELSVFPSTRPLALSEQGKFVRRTRVSANVDHEELAKNIHMTYLRKTPLVLECMGDKAAGIIAHSIALFNDRVQAHDMAAFVSIVSGVGKDGTELVKMEFNLKEEPKN